MINYRRGLLIALVSAFILPTSIKAQTSNKDQIKIAPNNWHQLDRATTGYYGISLDKAYDLLKGKKSKTVIVAVIDSGIDTLQEDLKPILWTNPGEIPGNGIDDDKNGYVDDVHGWNFLGGKDGQNVNQDSYEAARVYWKLKSKYGAKDPDTSALAGTSKDEAVMFLKAKNKVVGDVNPAEVMMLRRIEPVLKKGDSIIQKDLGKTEFNGTDLLSYNPTSMEAKTAAAIYMNIAKLNKSNDITNKQILDDFEGQLRKADAANTPPPNYRYDIVKDNYNDINDRYYGNNDIMAGTPTHGTHCSGIIGAVRNNGLGMNGIADNVRIMMIRAVPDGDEHDKDIANAIRYAVDNGAQVISMSFGKDFSPEKSWVDDAVRYAYSKDVLIVHAAGNDHKNIDTADNFPNPIFIDKKGRAANFITVGASGDATNGGFTASFSNYGKKEVDVFAPGVNIYSTLPGGNKYGNLSGTSMAAPVVAGLAALILEYYPNLTAEQIKYVIEKSVTPMKDPVELPGSKNEMDEDGNPTMVSLSDISKTGGEINAYNAIKLAATVKGERKMDNEILPKSKVIRKNRG
ncbi:MAG: S8 family peptidase [Ginsengibacter sp.]